MINASDIRASIGEFLAGEKDFDRFENWIISHSWDIHKSGDIETQVLSYGVELFLAEYNVNALSLADLRSELQTLANTYLLNPNQYARITTASLTSLTPSPWPVQPVGMPLATASELPVPR